MKTPVWFDIACSEWLKTWIVRSIPGNSGQRDFRSLALIAGVLFTLALLLLGSRAGLLDRFVDVFLGRLPESGVPVWLIAETSQAEAIGRQDIAKIIEKHPNLEVHPYLELESHEAALPGFDNKKNPSWRNPNNRKEKRAFNAWSVYPWDPLWKISSGAAVGGRKHPDLPLEVVLDKRQFRECFDCRAYLEELQENLPGESLKDIISDPSRQEELSCLDNGMIWLKVRTGWNRDANEFFKFRIIWSRDSGIPALEKLALLFPLGVHHAFMMSRNFNGMEDIYFPEGEGEKIDRLLALSIVADNDDPGAKSQILERCLGTPDIREQYEDELFLRFSNHPLRGDRVTDCIRQSDFPIKGEYNQPPPYVRIEELIRGERIRYYSDGFLSLPTKAAPPSMQRFVSRTDGAESVFDAVTLTNGYNNVIAYIPNHAGIKEMVGTLEKLKKKHVDGTRDAPMFYIHPTYQKALSRLSFLNDTIDSFRNPYMMIFLGIVVIIFYIQLDAIVGHRRHFFGILLAKGFRGIDIYLITWTQYMLCIIPGFFLAVISISIIRHSLNSKLLLIIAEYESHLNIINSDTLDLLPLFWRDYTVLFLTVLLTGIVIISFLLRINNLKIGAEPEPSTLLHG